MWSSSVCCILSLSLIISISPVDVGDLPNHVKYCVSVLSLLWAMIMNTTVPQGEQKSPTIGIRATTSGFSHQQFYGAALRPLRMAVNRSFYGMVSFTRSINSFPANSFLSYLTKKSLLCDLRWYLKASFQILSDY